MKSSQQSSIAVLVVCSFNPVKLWASTKFWALLKNMIQFVNIICLRRECVLLGKKNHDNPFPLPSFRMLSRIDFVIFPGSVRPMRAHISGKVTNCCSFREVEKFFPAHFAHKGFCGGSTLVSTERERGVKRRFIRNLRTNKGLDYWECEKRHERKFHCLDS